MGRFAEIQTLGDLTEWLAVAPHGTTVDAGAMLAVLERVGTGAPQLALEAPAVETTWRERLWTAPAETRIGVRELAEALGRPRSWVYRHTAPNGGKAPLPHRKLDGELVFVVGEIRAWVQEHEEEVVPPLPMGGLRATKLAGRRNRPAS